MSPFDDATLAAVNYIMDHYESIPDEDRAWFFWDVLEAYLEASLIIERRHVYCQLTHEPNKN
jgi:hypothetical protein